MPERPRRFLIFCTFLALFNMVAATQDVGWCVGGGGVMLMFLSLVNMVAATQDVGWWVGWGDVNVPCTC